MDRRRGGLCFSPVFVVVGIPILILHDSSISSANGSIDQVITAPVFSANYVQQRGLQIMENDGLCRDEVIDKKVVEVDRMMD